MQKHKGPPRPATTHPSHPPPVVQATTEHTYANLDEPLPITGLGSPVVADDVAVIALNASQAGHSYRNLDSAEASAAGGAPRAAPRGKGFAKRRSGGQRADQEAPSPYDYDNKDMPPYRSPSVRREADGRLVMDF